MKALIVQPGVADSARLETFPEPIITENTLLVEGHAIGVCGTDKEILEGRYGAAPPGEGWDPRHRRARHAVAGSLRAARRHQ